MSRKELEKKLKKLALEYKGEKEKAYIVPEPYTHRANIDTKWQIGIVTGEEDHLRFRAVNLAGTAVSVRVWRKNKWGRTKTLARGMNPIVKWKVNFIEDPLDLILGPWVPIFSKKTKLRASGEKKQPVVVFVEPIKI